MDLCQKTSICIMLLIGNFLWLDFVNSYNEPEYKIVCYYDTSAVNRFGVGKFLPENVSTNLCTHLMYAFANVSSNFELVSAFPNIDMPEGMNLYRRTTGLKKIKSSLKVLLSVGGWDFGSVLFSKMAENEYSRSIFVNSSVKLLRNYDFDGLDLDWEYPTFRNGTPADKNNFVLLVQELRTAFENEHKSSGKNILLLTAAVAAGEYFANGAYNASALSKYLDFFNVMTFDFHVVTDGWNTTNLHNALYSRKVDNSIESTLNVNWSMNYWESFDIPSKKLLSAIPFYGRSYILASSSQNGIGAPAFVSGGPGPITKNLEGMYASYEICLFIKNQTNSWTTKTDFIKNQTNSWTTKTDPEARTPYSFNSTHWISYDSKESVAEKIDYVKKNQLGGVMIWSIDQDDFQNICHDDKTFPLLRVINSLHNPNEHHTLY